MKTLVSGDCNPQNIFSLVDPTKFSEGEFEAEVHRALQCLMPDYDCRVFSGAFNHEGVQRKPDIAMVHRTLSHWFVAEVELVGHSLDAHVLPQLRCFRFGEPDATCVASLQNAFNDLKMSAHQAKQILENIPRATVCISNIRDAAWVSALRGLDVELLTVSVYEGKSGKRAYELDGNLSVRKEHLGYAQYSAIHAAIKVPRSIPIPLGHLQIDDQFGTPTDWMATDDDGSVWLTKRDGISLIPHLAWVQLIRSFDGRLGLRLPSYA
jgi:hypothetical protein